MQLMISTLDNPFNPHTQFDDWNSYDIQNGYNTCSYLDRIANVSNELSDQEQIAAINRAVEEIFRLNLTGNYIIVEN